MKKVSVITINYNHSKETLDCLNSILQSTYSNIDVIIVDNGSEIEDYQRLYNKVSNPKVHIVRQNKNSGYVGGVNSGLKEAQKYLPEYFLILNNDTVIDKNAISELVKTAEKHNNNAIVSGKVYIMDEPETLQYIGQWTKNMKKLSFPSYVKDGHELDLGQYDKEIKLGMSDDICWLLPYNIFKNVGYYSTDFFLYGEQNDYAIRAIKMGFYLIYTPHSKIWHYCHLTTSGGDI